MYTLSTLKLTLVGIFSLFGWQATLASNETDCTTEENYYSGKWIASDCGEHIKLECSENTVVLQYVPDNENHSPNFVNPVYPDYGDLKEVYIPNASVANFAARGFIGNVICYAQSKNDIPNPNNYSHSAFLFHCNPVVMLQVVANLMNDNNSYLYSHQRYGAEMIYKITAAVPEAKGVSTLQNLLPDTVFCAESTGTAKDVLRGIFPHVTVSPFTQIVMDYDGGVAFRPCLSDIPSDQTVQVVSQFLGHPYEGLDTLLGMLKAVNDKNKANDLSRLFCSELVALIYREFGVLPKDYIVSNVIPEEFSSAAGEYDILRGICGEDVVLKSRDMLGANGGCSPCIIS